MINSRAVIFDITRPTSWGVAQPSINTVASCWLLAGLLLVFIIKLCTGFCCYKVALSCNEQQPAKPTHAKYKSGVKGWEVAILIIGVVVFPFPLFYPLYIYGRTLSEWVSCLVCRFCLCCCCFSKPLYSLDFYFIITIVAVALLLLTFSPRLCPDPCPLPQPTTLLISIVFRSHVHIQNEENEVVKVHVKAKITLLITFAILCGFAYEL